MKCFSRLRRLRISATGRKVTTERRLYPGYIFIQMIMNDDTWHLVKNTPRVMEFLGGNRPTRIPESDIARIKGTVAEGVEKPKPRCSSSSAKRFV